VALFERAYLTAYDDQMTPRQRRRWHSWDDFMRGRGRARRPSRLSAPSTWVCSYGDAPTPPRCLE
jgi:hypothetical protein